MTKKEVLNRLQNGEKLVAQFNSIGADYYYIGDSPLPENRLNYTQFIKYKEMCINSDTSDNNASGRKFTPRYHYYWL